MTDLPRLLASCAALIALSSCKPGDGTLADSSAAAGSNQGGEGSPDHYDPDNPGTLIDLSPSGNCVRDVNGGAWCWSRSSSEFDLPVEAGEYIAPPVRGAVVTSLGLACAIDLEGQFGCWGVQNLYDDFFANQTIPPGPWESLQTRMEGVTCMLHEETRQPTCITIGEVKTFDSPPLASIAVGTKEVCGLTEADSSLWCGLMDSSRGWNNFEPLEGRYRDIALTDQMMCGITLDGGLECSAFNLDEFALELLEERVPPPYSKVSTSHDQVSVLAESGEAVIAPRWGEEADTPPDHLYSAIADLDRYVCGVTQDTNEVLCWGELGADVQPGHPISDQEPGRVARIVYPSGGGL